MTKREELIAQAEESHKQYPQYKGHWNTWVLATVKKRVRTKGGIAFEKGDVVLVKPTTEMHKVIPPVDCPYDQWPEKEFRTGYSFRINCNTQTLAVNYKL